MKDEPAHRHGADPVVVLFQDKNWLFSTWDRPGYRVSDDLVHWKYIPFGPSVTLPRKTYTAAAVIVLDDDRIPQRVIAFNKDFIGLVKRATGGNAWAPVSVMAHEIGHHLSGHTITPGGSQPPTELEADKFSGFVLYKMGASLDDASSASITARHSSQPAA